VKIKFIKNYLNCVRRNHRIYGSIFTFYPTATDKELAYYVKNNVLPPIDEDYIFSELVNPIFQQSGNQVHVWISVKYLDGTTKAMQLSQYLLALEKDTNWTIVE